MRELLESKGWTYDHGCRCGGALKQWFFSSQFPGITIKIFPDKLKYRVSKGGKKLAEGSAGELENYLNGLVA